MFDVDEVEPDDEESPLLPEDDEPEDEPLLEEPELELPPPFPPPPPPPLRFSSGLVNGIEEKESTRERTESACESGMAAALTVEVTPKMKAQVVENFMM